MLLPYGNGEFPVFVMASVPTFAWQVRYQNCLKSQANTFVKTNYKYVLLWKEHGLTILNQIEKLQTKLAN